MSDEWVESFIKDSLIRPREELYKPFAAMIAAYKAKGYDVEEIRIFFESFVSEDESLKGAQALYGLWMERETAYGKEKA